jgi:uncharacterized protein (TIGR03083 family)
VNVGGRRYGHRVDYAADLTYQTRLLGELIDKADPNTPVPTCPGWGLVQLFRHVGRGHRWAAQMIVERVEAPLDPRSVPDGKPPADPAAALAWLNGSAEAVLAAVAEVGAQTPVWTFNGPRPASWWIRRRLHEATVHRADAAIALDVDYVLSPELAADGVAEWLEIVAGGRSDGVPLAPGATLHLHATDEGLGEAGEWLVRGDSQGISWSPGHGKGDAALRGRAVDLLLAITRRQTAEQLGIEQLGDDSVWSTWLARTPF